MSKVAIVFWSGTGNTQAMAEALEAALLQNGAETALLTAAEFTPDMVSSFDAIAFGCPAMGDEVLEETEFEPMFTSVESALQGKKTGLFGSFGWGDGQWMRDWEDRARVAGAVLAADGVIANDAPDDEALASLTALAAALI
ncbi:MAG: flavodoxin [Clostridiales bacterium]|nr:flavodoxin [Clostridiales bacterium]